MNMAEDTWNREQRLMETIRAFETDRPDERTRDKLVAATGLPKDEVDDGVRALLEASYIDGRETGSMDELFDWWDLRLRERGRRAVKQWPSDDPGETLVQLLEERLSQASDPAERSRLSQVLDAVRDVGTGVLSGVLSDLVRRMAGL